MSQLQVTGEAKIRDIQGPVVANSGVITALDGAANQYVRGDGTLASFPTSGGGGSSVSYYLNGSVNQGTFGGSTYYQMSKNAIVGTGTNFSASANGLIAQFITDANDPDVVSIPSGNWNLEFFMNVSASSGALASFYVEFYKYNGSTFTLLATNVATPEQLTNTTTVDAYYTSVAMPLSTMAVTDRLAIRIFVNVAGKTVTLYTEDNRLCQVVTTFSKGLASLNNLTDQSQYLTTGTSGTNFAIVSSGDTHTFNLPVASATNTGKLSNTDWSTFNNKVPYTGATGDVNLGLYNISAQNAFLNGVSGVNGGNLFLKQDIDFGQSAGYTTLYSTGKNLGFVSYVGSFTYNALFSLNSLTNNSTRTFTIPDLSGTLALLEGTQTFSGAKTFSGGASFTLAGGIVGFSAGVAIDKGTAITKGSTPASFSPSSSTLYSALGDNNLIIRDSTNTSTLQFQASSSYTYTFPASSGTIALTSNINYPVTSVFGRTGAVVAASGDYTTTQVTEGTNLYYTDARARGALSFVAGSGAYNSTTGVITIPTNNNQITNGAGYITSSALSDYLPLTGGTLTGGLSGTTATFSGLGTFYQLTMTGATAGRIFYAQTGGVVSQSGNLNWNETNGMLGVGTPNPSAVITAFSNNAATQFKAAGTAPAFTFSNTLTSASYACVFGLATSANHFITGTAAGDMAIANQSATAGAIVFGTGTAEKMRMSSSGNIGIGVTPSAWGSIFSNGILQVKTSSLLSYNNNTYLTTNGYFTNSGDNYIGNGFASRYIQTSGNHIWENAPNNTSGADAVLTLQERMRITSGGNVLIGTTGDNGAKLQVSGAATFSSSVTIGTTASTIYGTLNVIQQSVSAPSFVRGIQLVHPNGTGTTGGYIAMSMTGQKQGTIQVGDDAASGNLLLQSQGGNVGIGTSSPSYKLHVYNTAATDVAMLESTQVFSTLAFKSSTNSSSATIGIDGAGNAAFENKLSSGNMTFVTNGSERMRITSGGLVLIGTTSGTAAYRLKVDNGSSGGILAVSSGTGDANFFSSSDSIGYHFYCDRGSAARFYVIGTGQIYSTSTSITAISDIRHKENIRPLETGLTEILQLKPSRFDWKEGKGTGKKDVAGFIAQDIEEILPDLVDEWKETMQSTEAFKSIRMGDLIPTLVKAIQEQTQIIKDLEARIKQLENK